MAYPEDGWVCPQCGWVAKRNKRRETTRGRHLYDGDVVRCSSCAEAWCKATFPGPDPHARP